MRNLLRAQAPHGTSYFAYDKVNRQVRDQEPYVGTSYFEYDAAGNRARLGYPDGGYAEYGYDAANRMMYVVSPDGIPTYYAYDATGLMLRKLLGNGSGTYYAYDTAGRMAYLKNVQADGTPLSYFTYGRLSGGNIDRILREAGFTIYYSYDQVDRLTKEVWRDVDHSQIYSFMYDYDFSGNRATGIKNGIGVYYYYDVANQLEKSNEIGSGWIYYHYDDNGSSISEISTSGITYYEYADNGLAKKLILPSGITSIFYYNANMHRCVFDINGTITYYGWDGVNQLVEKDSSLANIAEYTHGYTAINGIGTNVVTKRNSYFQYPHYDQRGSLINLHVAGDGDLKAEYDAFGVELERTGSLNSYYGYQGTSWLRLSGKQYITPTRLYCCPFGRFIQMDLLFRSPMVLMAFNQLSNQLFSQMSQPIYVSNNPVNYVDPLGLSKCIANVYSKDSLGIPIASLIGAGHLALELIRGEGDQTLIELQSYSGSHHPDTSRIGSGPLGPFNYIRFLFWLNWLARFADKDNPILSRIDDIVHDITGGYDVESSLGQLNNLLNRLSGITLSKFYGIFRSKNLVPPHNNKYNVQLTPGHEDEECERLDRAAIAIAIATVNPVLHLNIHANVTMGSIGPFELPLVRINEPRVQFRLGYDPTLRNSNTFIGTVFRDANVRPPSEIVGNIGFSKDFKKMTWWDLWFQGLFPQVK